MSYYCYLHFMILFFHSVTDPILFLLIDFSLQFNARSESVKEKASFRRLIPKNRCLVAVEGYGNMAECWSLQLLLIQCHIFIIPPSLPLQVLFDVSQEILPNRIPTPESDTNTCTSVHVTLSGTLPDSCSSQLQYE